MLPVVERCTQEHPIKQDLEDNSIVHIDSGPKLHLHGKRPKNELFAISLCELEARIEEKLRIQ